MRQYPTGPPQGWGGPARFKDRDIGAQLLGGLPWNDAVSKDGKVARAPLRQMGYPRAPLQKPIPFRQRIREKP